MNSKSAEHPNYRFPVPRLNARSIADVAHRADISICGTNGYVFEASDIPKKAVRTFKFGVCAAQTANAVTRAIPCMFAGSCADCAVIDSIRGAKLSPREFIPRRRSVQQA